MANRYEPAEWLSWGDRRACSNTGHSQDGGSPPTPRNFHPLLYTSQTCPTGMGRLEKRREVEGCRDWGMEVEVWECRGRRRRRGVSVSIRHRLTADSCARRGHGQLTRTRPGLASCVRTCVSVQECVRAPWDAHIYTSHLPSNSSHILLAISLPLSASLPPQPVRDILQVNQSVSASWHESTAFIQSTPCLSYLLKYFYLNWPSNQSTFLPL